MFTYNQVMFTVPREKLLTHLSKLKDLRMYLGVRLYGDPSCVSNRSMFLHPASARALNAPHTSSSPPLLPRSFNILSSKKPICSFQTSAFTPDGFPPLSASCFEGPPYVFLRQLTSSSPTCSLFPPVTPNTSALLSDSLCPCLEIHPR